jgi:hypothetical protein
VTVVEERALIEKVLREGVDPAETRLVQGEPLTLPNMVPERWKAGCPLHGIVTGFRGRDTIPVPNALDAGSVVVTAGGRTLRSGIDFQLDPVWGTLGRAGETPVPAAVDYRYSLRRLDSVAAGPDGLMRLLRGRSHLTSPLPPALPPGARLLANVYVPYFSDGTRYEVFGFSEPATIISPPQPGALPHTAARLRAHEKIRIACWGDSVTAGGDASSPHTEYPAVLERRLRATGVNADVTTVAVDGSKSAQWISAESPDGCDWARVEDVRPHLVTVEFVNDASLDPARWPVLYAEILRRVTALGAELLITTPHFTMPGWMGTDNLKAADPRPYTRFLRSFCRTRSLALADVARRWEHLHLEAIPYPTMLHNGINHPDDRGHQIVAEELCRALAGDRL